MDDHRVPFTIDAWSLPVGHVVVPRLARIGEAGVHDPELIMVLSVAVGFEVATGDRIGRLTGLVDLAPLEERRTRVLRKRQAGGDLDRNADIEVAWVSEQIWREDVGPRQ